MSEAKHSPGPWREGGRANEGINALRIISADHVIIADVLFHGRNSHIAPLRDVAEANARLIESAPDLERQRDALLEACEGLMGHIEDGTLVRDTTKDGNPMWAISMVQFVADLKNAQAAIALARDKIP